MKEVKEIKSNDLIICALVSGAHGDRVLELTLEDDPDDLDLMEIVHEGQTYWVSQEDWLGVDEGSPDFASLQAFQEMDQL